MKFVTGLFSFTLNSITNEDFSNEAKVASFAFSRKHKFSLKDLTIVLLGFSRASVKVELDRFFKFVSQDYPKVISYTKSAFTQARKKLKAEAFVYLRDKQLVYFDKNAPNKKFWHGYRVVAVDGSSIRLPNERCLRDYFGSFSNKKSAVAAGAKISIAYDVCNQLVLDALIARADDDEKALAKIHLDNLNPVTDILVYDRGYPGVMFFHELKCKGFKFCFRLSSSWKEAYKLLNTEGDDINWNFEKGYRTRSGTQKHIPLPEELTGLRLIRVPLKNGETEVLVTNLTDRNEYPLSVLKELYHMRWSVEECYKKLKQISQIEYFSGRTIHAVKQDFYARVILLNMASMIETQNLEPILESKTGCRKYGVQINKTQLIAKIKDFIIDIFYGRNTKVSIDKMLQLAVECYDIVRPDRHFKRIRGFRYHRKPLMYKGL